jgi:hypothetical protein
VPNGTMRAVQYDRSGGAEVATTPQPTSAGRIHRTLDLQHFADGRALVIGAHPPTLMSYPIRFEHRSIRRLTEL